MDEGLGPHPSDRSRTPAFSTVPGDLRAGNAVSVTSANYLRRKQYLRSVRSPEIPENFKRTQHFFLLQ
jgi:hypothetical protein